MIGHSVQLFNDFLKSGLLRFIPAHHQSLEVSSVSFDKCSPLCSPCHRLPCSSAGEESACKAGDPSSTPGLGRSPGEGKGYLLQYSWTSQEAQTVKNLPAMQETLVQCLSWEDPLEKGKTTHSNILAWEIPSTEEPGELQSIDSQRVGHD